MSRRAPSVGLEGLQTGGMGITSPALDANTSHGFLGDGRATASGVAPPEEKHAEAGIAPAPRVSEHTPGPFRVKAPSGPQAIGDGGLDRAVVAMVNGSERVIGEAFGRVGVSDYVNADANADLFAAAPELADALDALLVILDSKFVHVEVATKKEADQVTAAREAGVVALRRAGRL